MGREREAREISFSTPIVARDMAAAEHFNHINGEETIDAVGMLLMFHSWDIDQVGKVECRPLLRRLQRMIDDHIRERYLATGAAPTPRQAIDGIWGIATVNERFKALPSSKVKPSQIPGVTSTASIPMAALWSMLETLVSGEAVH